MTLAIMQGRLVPPSPGRIQSFPRDLWRDEFSLAAEAGLGAIEWIYDEHGEDVNPIATDEGISAIRRLSDQSGIAVHSLCADYFMEYPLLRADADQVERRLATLWWLLGRCALLGMQRLVLPFVDASGIESDDEMASVEALLRRTLPVISATHVEIHLETSLAPSQFAALLSALPAESIKVNYDSGNSASLGFVPGDEFAAYGSRVGSVHIKDRVNGGSTVPLGEGDTDFASLFECLSGVGYRGDFVLQAARGRTGNEVEWARMNRAFVLGYLSRSA